MFFNRNKNVHSVSFFVFALALFSIQCLAHSKFDLPERLNNKYANDVFDSLIDNYDPLDLAPGDPDLLPPSFLRSALSNATNSLDASVHHYMHHAGYPELRKEIAGLYSKLINRPLDMSKNVVVTEGVTQALYLVMLAHTKPGDEWIVLEPAYGTYFAIINMVGGTVRSVALRANSTESRLSSRDLTFNKDELRKAFNSRTKGILVNSPHNPTGKVFTKEELSFIAELAIKWDTLIISDEVYEWTTFDSNKHVRMASLGEHIFNRTIALSSMSKTFFATGWRVGWAYGPSKLIENLKTQQPFIILSGNSYVQIAAADVFKRMRNELGHPRSYFATLAKFLEHNRNDMIKMLDKIGMDTIVPQAGYYVYANWTSIRSRTTGLEREDGNTEDIKFIKWLVKNAGVLTYPGSAMYLGEGKKMGQNFVRLCFAKRTETLKKAATLLQKRFL